MFYNKGKIFPNRVFSRINQLPLATVIPEMLNLP